MQFQLNTTVITWYHKNPLYGFNGILCDLWRSISIPSRLQGPNLLFPVLTNPRHHEHTHMGIPEFAVSLLLQRFLGEFPAIWVNTLYPQIHMFWEYMWIVGV